MKIKIIGYGRVIPDGNYGNNKYYAEAELEDWEDPAASLEVLREWVASRHGIHFEVANLLDKKADLTDAIQEIEQKITRFARLWNKAENRWNETVAFLEKHGVKTTETLPVRPRFEHWIAKTEMITATAEPDDDDVPF